MPAKAAAKPVAKKKADPKSNKSSGSKGKKKKWTKVHVKETLTNAILWDPKTINRLETDVPKYRVITVHVVSDRLKVNGSLARAGLQHLVGKKLIKEVVKGVYTRRISASDE